MRQGGAGGAAAPSDRRAARAASGLRLRTAPTRRLRAGYLPLPRLHTLALSGGAEAATTGRTIASRAAQ